MSNYLRFIFIINWRLLGKIQFNIGSATSVKTYSRFQFLDKVINEFGVSANRCSSSCHFYLNRRHKRNNRENTMNTFMSRLCEDSLQYYYYYSGILGIPYRSFSITIACSPLICTIRKKNVHEPIYFCKRSVP